MRRAMQVGDLDPAKARDELRSSLRDLSQLVTFAMCVIAEGDGSRKVDRLSELAFTVQTIGIMMQGVATSIASILRQTEVIDASPAHPGRGLASALNHAAGRSPMGGRVEHPTILDVSTDVNAADRLLAG